MQVRVRSFGVLTEWLGGPTADVRLEEGATVAALLAQLSASRSTPLLAGIAVSVNAEFASAAHRLAEGDEVGLLPPVSGGCSAAARTTREQDRRCFARCWCLPSSRWM